MSVNTAKGTALSRLTIHRPAMIRTGRCSPDIVYRCSGWQMARKRSIENATIVSTDTYVDASDISARILQNASPRLYGYWCQYRLISYGRPAKGMVIYVLEIFKLLQSKPSKVMETETRMQKGRKIRLGTFFVWSFIQFPPPNLWQGENWKKEAALCRIKFRT